METQLIGRGILFGLSALFGSAALLTLVVAFRVGDFQIADPLLGAPVASFSGVLGLTASAQTTCTLSVQFRLQR